MKRQSLRVRLMKVAMGAAVGGSTFALTGCDPTIRSTLVGGLESTVQSIATTYISTYFLSLGDGNATGGGGLTTTAP